MALLDDSASVLSPPSTNMACTQRSLTPRKIRDYIYDNIVVGIPFEECMEVRVYAYVFVYVYV